MIHLNISLTSLAAILWSGMLIVAGSIWILSSQVRKLVDLLEEQSKAAPRGDRAGRRPTAIPREVVRRVVDRSSNRVN